MRKLIAILVVLSFAGPAQADTFGFPLPGQYPGTTTNDNAAAGNVGEYIASSIAQGSAISLTTSTNTDLTTISLTAGDWDVWCMPVFLPAATTTVTQLVAYINTTTAGTATPGQIAQIIYPNAALGNNYFSVTAGPARISLSATTTYRCVVSATFATSTMTVFGLLRARRMR